MRHLGSLLAGLVAAPLAWVLVAVGQARTEQTFTRWNDADTVFTGDLLAPLGLVTAGGVVIGLVGCLRWSPVGPLVAGSLFLAGYGVALVRPFELLDRLPEWRIAGTRADLAVPLTNGTLAVLGAALLMAAFSRARWRRWPTVTAPAAVAPAAAAAADTDTEPVAVEPTYAEPVDAEPGPPPPAETESLPSPEAPAAAEPPTPTPTPMPMPRSGPKPDTAEDLPWRGPRGDPTVMIPGPRHAAPDDFTATTVEPPAQRSPIEPTFQYGPPAPDPDEAPPEPDREAPAGPDETAEKTDEPAAPPPGTPPPEVPPFSSPWAGPPRPPQE